MYLQKFKEKARTVQDPKMKSFSSKEELIPKWDDKDFGYGPRDILWKAITRVIYEKSITNPKKIKGQEED